MTSVIAVTIDVAVGADNDVIDLVFYTVDNRLDKRLAVIQNQPLILAANATAFTASQYDAACVECVWRSHVSRVTL